MDEDDLNIREETQKTQLLMRLRQSNKNDNPAGYSSIWPLLLPIDEEIAVLSILFAFTHQFYVLVNAPLEVQVVEMSVTLPRPPAEMALSQLLNVITQQLAMFWE